MDHESKPIVSSQSAQVKPNSQYQVGVKVLNAGAKTSDPFTKFVDEITAHTKQEGLVLYYGLKEGTFDTAVYWNEERGGDWRKFLNVAKALGARVVYLNWSPFEEFQVDEALSSVPDDEEFDDPDSEERDQQIEAYREKVGLIAQIDLAFVVDGVTHIYRRSPDWFEAFQALVHEAGDEDEQELPEPRVDKATVDKWARSLATHEKYAGCKTHDQRRYLLEQLAGDDYGTLPVNEVLKRADTVYTFEVRPEQEKELRARARTLREHGLNLNAIGQKLGISRDRVSALLAD